MGGKKFTQEELNTAIQMIQEEYSYQEISRKLKNRSASSVKQKLQSLKVVKSTYTRKPFTQSEINLMTTLYKKGKNYTEISRELNRDSSAIADRLKALGIAKPIKKRNNNYHYKINDEVNGLKIVEQIRIKQGKYTRKGYIVKSLAYPDDKNDYEMTEDSLKRGYGCAYTSGNRIIEETSLYSIKHLRPYFVDIKQAKTTARNSHKSILFRCRCGTEKKMTVSDLVKQGFTCPICSKGTSYPERYMSAYLTVKNIPHETQVIYEDLSDRRFDFRIKLNGVPFLLEVHGAQHFLTEDKGYHKVETIQESDNIKRNYAKGNNINYIELDCSKSSFEFIRKMIELNEHLPNIEDSEIDAMLEIMEHNSKYPVKEIVDMYTVGRKTTYQIAEIVGKSYATINEILRKNNIELRSNAKLIRCVETGQVFQSSVEASRELEVPKSSISHCAIGNKKSAKGFTFEYLTDIEVNAYHHVN